MGKGFGSMRTTLENDLLPQASFQASSAHASLIPSLLALPSLPHTPIILFLPLFFPPSLPPSIPIFSLFLSLSLSSFWSQESPRATRVRSQSPMGNLNRPTTAVSPKRYSTYFQKISTNKKGTDDIIHNSLQSRMKKALSPKIIRANAK